MARNSAFIACCSNRHPQRQLARDTSLVMRVKECSRIQGMHAAGAQGVEAYDGSSARGKVSCRARGPTSQSPGAAGAPLRGTAARTWPTGPSRAALSMRSQARRQRAACTQAHRVRSAPSAKCMHACMCDEDWPHIDTHTERECVYVAVAQHAHEAENRAPCMRATCICIRLVWTWAQYQCWTPHKAVLLREGGTRLKWQALCSPQIT